MATPTLINYIAVRNTIARYSLALDTHDTDLLKRVFTPDANVSYPTTGEIKGLDKLAGLIKEKLAPVTPQHNLTTQHIEVAADGKTAQATTYFIAVHFGQGKWEGKEVTAWGIYTDRLVCLPAAGSDADQQDILPGSSGRWLISYRHVKWLARRGCEDVMKGEDGQ